jgi:hypothetical protein
MKTRVVEVRYKGKNTEYFPQYKKSIIEFFKEGENIFVLMVYLIVFIMAFYLGSNKIPFVIWTILFVIVLVFGYGFLRWVNHKKRDGFSIKDVSFFSLKKAISYNERFIMDLEQAEVDENKEMEKNKIISKKIIEPTPRFPGMLE